MEPNFFASLPNATYEEVAFIQQTTAGLTDTQKQAFMSIYYNRRKSAQDILIFTLIGFVGFAGIQRFVTGQIAMGILYFFTAGFCLIGTIVDLVNHKSLANEYNRKVAYESMEMARMTA